MKTRLKKAKKKMVKKNKKESVKKSRKNNGWLQNQVGTPSHGSPGLGEGRREGNWG